MKKQGPREGQLSSYRFGGVRFKRRRLAALEQCWLMELFVMMEMFYICMCNMVVSGHTWRVSPWSVASETEAPNLKFNFMFMNLNRHMYVVAAVMESAAPSPDLLTPAVFTFPKGRLKTHCQTWAALYLPKSLNIFSKTSTRIEQFHAQMISLVNSIKYLRDK